ncbi:hypothetical protein Q2T40_01415 [Winogradskyella maritima]|nr:hypothetical protein [Winogradskyella maritima]
MRNPTVLDAENPRLAWISVDPKYRRGQAQFAYQILWQVQKKN